MSPELIAILSIGAGQISTTLWLIARMDRRFERIETRLAGVEQRQAKLEGLLEGLREAISGRRVPTDAA